MSKSKVAVLKATSASVLEDYHKLTELAGIENFLQKDKVTILKDNISWHYPFPGANTTPWQLEGTILSLKQSGYENLVTVHNNTVVTNPFKGGQLNKLSPIYNKYNISEKYNFRSDDIKWIHYKPKGNMLVLAKVYSGGVYIPEYFFDKNIIHLPTMKCHIYTTTTGAMKNAFGGLLNTKRHYTHSVIHETLVDLLTIQKEIHAGIFAIMDGTTAGNGSGPRTMKPVQTNLILASGDQVAIDAVAAKLMGFNPMSIKYISLAHEAGLGIGKPGEIEMVGDDISHLNCQFSVGDNLASRVGDLFWFSNLKFLQKLLFHTPLVYTFIFGSAFYHDWFWWPLKGKKYFNNWQTDSPWGKLFEEKYL